MSEELIERVMKEVMKKIGEKKAVEPAPASPKSASINLEPDQEDKLEFTDDLIKVTEFVGAAIGDTMGIVIANLDPSIHELMGFDKKYRSIGIIGGRVGAGPQLMAADDAVKATNTEIIRVEMPRDTKGGAGHGNLIIFGAEDVSDARRAVEVTLEVLPKYFGDVYTNEQGYTENQYSARASKCLEKAFNTPEGKAFGLILGAPAVIGMLMVDTAVKSADVEVVGYGSPANGTSFTNEVFIWVTGDSGAVRQAVVAGREVGNQLLGAWGEEPKSMGTPYI